MPGVSGVTVVTNARVYYTTRGCGRIGRPAFPAPSVREGGKFPAQLGRIAPRDREGVFEFLNVIASEAKQSVLSLLGEMDCFASLAMTALGPMWLFDIRIRSPVARLS
jgi:hypothetical protein